MNSTRTRLLPFPGVRVFVGQFCASGSPESVYNRMMRNLFALRRDPKRLQALIDVRDENRAWQRESKEMLERLREKTPLELELDAMHANTLKWMQQDDAWRKWPFLG